MARIIDDLTFRLDFHFTLFLEKSILDDITDFEDGRFERRAPGRPLQARKKEQAVVEYVAHLLDSGYLNGPQPIGEVGCYHIWGENRSANWTVGSTDRVRDVGPFATAKKPSTEDNVRKDPNVHSIHIRLVSPVFRFDDLSTARAHLVEIRPLLTAAPVNYHADWAHGGWEGLQQGYWNPSAACLVEFSVDGHPIQSATFRNLLVLYAAWERQIGQFHPNWRRPWRLSHFIKSVYGAFMADVDPEPSAYERAAAFRDAMRTATDPNELQELDNSVKHLACVFARPEALVFTQETGVRFSHAVILPWVSLAAAMYQFANDLDQAEVPIPEAETADGNVSAFFDALSLPDDLRLAVKIYEENIFSR